MADLTTQNASAGLGDVQFAAAASGGDTAQAGVSAGGWRLCGVLLVANGDAAAHTVTVEGVDDPVNVPAGGTAVVPLDGGGIAGQRLTVDYDAVTSVTVAVVHF